MELGHPVQIKLEGGEGNGKRLEEELTKAIQNLTLQKKNPKKEESMPGLLSKLGAAREKKADEERQRRRAIWRAGNSKEVVEREAFSDEMFPFPEVVWDAIFKQVEDSAEKKKLSNMSLLWRDLMKKERTRFLFHEVFAILQDGGCLQDVDLFSFRTVCQEWRKCVDNSLQNFIKPAEFSTEFPFPEQLSLLPIRMPGSSPYYHLWPMNGAKWACFVEIYVSSLENPFSMHKASVRLTNDMIRLDWFFEGLTRILQKWGREIWDFHVSFEDDYDFMRVMDFLLDHLPLMPNLKYLGVVCSYRPLCLEAAAVVPPCKDDPRGAKTLPELPYLKSLFTMMLNYTIEVMLLNKYQSTLEFVSLNGYHQLEDDLCMGLPFPQLKEYTCSSFISEMIEPVRVKDWPMLEEMRLILRNVAKKDIVPNFESLAIFGKRLRRLQLTVEKCPGPILKLEEGIVKRLSLALPRVEQFHLSVSRLNLKTIDFILPMESLKELSLRYVKFVSSFKTKEQVAPPGSGSSAAAPTTSTAASSEEVIQFSEYTNRLYESNIWKLFPGLRKVKIEIARKLKRKNEPPGIPVRFYEDRARAYGDHMDVDGPVESKWKVYTREGYEQHCKMQNTGRDGVEISN